MTHHRPLLVLASLALATSVLGACSPGASSPTEPSIAFDSTAKSFAAADPGLDSVAGDDTAKRHGSDDGSSGGSGGSNDDGTADQGNRGSGNGNGDDNGGRGRRGRRPRGADDPQQQPRQPRAGQEFEATVRSVNGQTITLVTGTRVIVNGQTQWSARGDLLSLSALAGAVNANRSPRVEGRGNRQADGAIVALTIKAEIDN